MAYLGNLSGPRESQPIDCLGRDYFGVTRAQLAKDIEMHEDAQRREEVQPVQVDRDGRPYIVLSRPGGRTSKFYLGEHAWLLAGGIKTFTPKERDAWEANRLREGVFQEV